MLRVITNDKRVGYEVVGGAPDKNGYVFTKWTIPNTGTIVLDAGPGECSRGGNNWPEDPTDVHNLKEQPIFGVGNVGNGAVFCKVPCIDTSTYYLPVSGGDFAMWFVQLVLSLIP